MPIWCDAEPLRTEPSWGRHGRYPVPVILVVGGANLDSTLRTQTAAVLRTSNPATLTQSAGGVGRNIAENLARLGHTVVLVAPIGADAAGRELLDRTSAAGVDCTHVVASAHPTGAYVAVVDDAGELVIGASDMTAADALTIPDLAAVPTLLRHTALLVLDGNLPAAISAYLLDAAALRTIPVVIDPVSIRKAEMLSEVLGWSRPVHTITPNLAELAVLTGCEVTDEAPEIAAVAGVLHARGVDRVWVRRGPGGSLLSAVVRGEQQVARYAAPHAEVIDVTGAGDSMTAGYVHALLTDGDAFGAAAYGQALAALTVESAHTVRPDLSTDLVADRISRGGIPVLRDPTTGRATTSHAQGEP